MDGSVGSAVYQVGGNAGDQLSFNWNTSMRNSAQGGLQMLTTADLRTTNGGSGGGFQFAGTYTTPAIGNLDFSIPASPFRGGNVTTAGAVNLSYASSPTTFKVDGTSITLNSDFTNLDALVSAIQGRLSGAYSVANNGGGITLTKTASAANATAAPVTQTISGSSPFDGATATAGAAAVTATFAGFNVDGHRVYINSNYSGDEGGLIADIQAQLDGYSGLAGVYQVSGGSAGVSIAKVGSLVPPSVGGFVGTGATTFSKAASDTMTLGAGDFTLQMGAGPVVSITGSFTNPDQLAAAIMHKVAGIYASVDTTTGKLKLLSSQSFTVSGTQADASGSLGFDGTTSQTNGNLGTVNLLNPSSAVEVVMRVDEALDNVNQTRASLGAYQNRLMMDIANLQNSNANVAQARGRIVDADYAQELAHLAKHQILQQAGVAMLAQANMQARSVLALLR